MHALRGANYFSWDPAVVMRLDLGAFDERPTNEIPGFIERLKALIPTLYEHKCSEGRAGGFYHRMELGTLLGHVCEHVAIELQNLAGIDVAFGKTRSTLEPGVYNVVFRFETEAAGFHAGRVAVNLLNAILEERPFDVASGVAEIAELARAEARPAIEAALLTEARRRGIPVVRLGSPNDGLVQLGLGCHRRMLHVASNGSILPDDTPMLAGMLPTCLLNSHGASRPGNSPVAASRPSEPRPRLYRLLVLGGKLASALKMAEAVAVGDGQQSVAQLLDALNAQPARSHGRLRPVARGPRLAEVLSAQGLTPQSVPPPGAHVVLADDGDVANGVAAVEVTADVHPDVMALAEDVARRKGQPHLELLVEAVSLREPPAAGRFEIIESPARLDLDHHLRPSAGTGRPVVRELLGALFPPGRPTHAPHVAITGAHGKSLCAAMLRQLLSSAPSPLMPGCIITTQGRDDVSALPEGEALRRATGDPRHQVILGEVARRTILREGLPYELSDIGIVLGTHPDQVGCDDIRDPEDLAYAYAVVAEQVRDDGYAILPADDPVLHEALPRLYGKPVLFSTTGTGEALATHLDRGGVAVIATPEAGMVLRRGRYETLLASPEEVPAPGSGWPIEPALAAVAAAHCLSVGEDHLRACVLGWSSALPALPGRRQVRRLAQPPGIEILMDCPPTLMATGRLLASLGTPPLATVVEPDPDRSPQAREALGRALAEAGCRELILMAPAAQASLQAAAAEIARGFKESSASSGGQVQWHEELDGGLDAATAALRASGMVQPQARLLLLSPRSPALAGSRLFVAPVARQSDAQGGLS